MNNPRPDGLSSQDEFDILIALEEDITAAVQRDAKALYVGRNTSSGNRDFYFYTSDQSIERVFTAAMENWTSYNFRTGTRSDPEWAAYWHFLHPSPEDLQRIADRDVVNCLIDNGDRIEVPRKIDHLAVFKTSRGREVFAQHLIANGYAISKSKDNDGEFQIEFDRLDRPDEIGDVTLDLYRTARENGGEYDGWGCHTANWRLLVSVRCRNRTVCTPPESDI